MKTYKQLTYEQRCQIYILKNSKKSQQEIADSIGVSQSTVSREFKWNRGQRGYRYKQAQERSDARRRAAAKALKMRPEVIQIISRLLK